MSSSGDPLPPGYSLRRFLFERANPGARYLYEDEGGFDGWSVDSPDQYKLKVTDENHELVGYRGAIEYYGPIEDANHNGFDNNTENDPSSDSENGVSLSDVDVDVKSERSLESHDASEFSTSNTNPDENGFDDDAKNDHSSDGENGVSLSDVDVDVKSERSRENEDASELSTSRAEDEEIDEENGEPFEEPGELIQEDIGEDTEEQVEAGIAENMEEEIEGDTEQADESDGSNTFSDGSDSSYEEARPRRSNKNVPSNKHRKRALHEHDVETDEEDSRPTKKARSYHSGSFERQGKRTFAKYAGENDGDNDTDDSVEYGQVSKRQKGPNTSRTGSLQALGRVGDIIYHNGVKYDLSEIEVTREGWKSFDNDVRNSIVFQLADNESSRPRNASRRYNRSRSPRTTGGKARLERSATTNNTVTHLPPASNTPLGPLNPPNNNATGNQGRNRRGAWTAAEMTALCDAIVNRRNLEANNHGAPRLVDVSLFRHVAQELAAQGINRTFGACKNQWSRFGRLQFGIDERLPTNKARSLTTSTQTTSRTQAAGTTAATAININDVDGTEDDDEYESGDEEHGSEQDLDEKDGETDEEEVVEDFVEEEEDEEADTSDDEDFIAKNEDEEDGNASDDDE
ncbi:hypothetical protein PVAG01_04060 [Phlyctema vagabunda]|uniref:Myb-like domain-containing protein n=1 Tax=Phlyctema vagabunda TaxID=108571 RepID=A0ABR4PN90_9HELO